MKHKLIEFFDGKKGFENVGQLKNENSRKFSIDFHQSILQKMLKFLNKFSSKFEVFTRRNRSSVKMERKKERNGEDDEKRKEKRQLVKKRVFNRNRPVEGEKYKNLTEPFIIVSM